MNLTWLKKAGLELLKGAQIVEGVLVGVGPGIGILNPKAGAIESKIQSEIEQFLNIAAAVEASGAAIQLPGPQKLQQSIPLFGQAIAQSAALVGKKIADRALYDKAVAEYAQASVDLANSLHPDVNTTSLT